MKGLIHYVTGSRADFGLMEKTLQYLGRQSNFDIGVVVTGQHLVPHYGYTRDEIVAAGVTIVAEIPVTLTGRDGVEMGYAFAHELTGFLETWRSQKPDLVMVLGDRGEMLAAALAAVHLGIPVVHLHGGEVSGTIDESLRHAITKLSHYHFPATQDSANRLIKMGESSDRVWVVGAPGLVGLTDGVCRNSAFLHDEYNVEPSECLALVLFHPVVQEAELAGQQMNEIINFLSKQDCSGIIMRPNSDAGGAAIDKYFSCIPEILPRFVICDHLTRDAYLSVLSSIDVVIGNSSSGIIESASFNIACLNLGSRQDGRLRNSNVIDCPQISQKPLATAFKQARNFTGPFDNQYGDGQTHLTIAKILADLHLDRAHLSKRITY